MTESEFQRLDGARKYWLLFGPGSKQMLKCPNSNFGQLKLNMCYHALRDGCPSWFWEDMAMRVSSLFVASPAVAILSIELLCGLSGTAMSQTATRSATSLPTSQSKRRGNQAEAQRGCRCEWHGSCVGGCVTSFRVGDAPWRGCSGSGWPALSPTCRNVGNYKTYTECMEAGLKTGWRSNETGWYCSSLALK